MPKPFEQHIPYYPGEERIILPTLETSTFFSPTEVKSSRLIDEILSPQANSKARANTYTRIREFCQQGNYPVFRSLVEQQLEASKSNESGNNIVGQTVYEDLLSKLNREFEPPQNVRLRAIFRRHAIHSAEDYDNTVDETLSQMRMVFRPEEENIFVDEDSGGRNFNVTQIVNQLMQQYKSLRKAYAHIALLNHGHVSPTESEIMNVVSGRDEMKADSDIERGAFRYSNAEYKAIDILLAEGFSVTYMTEAPTVQEKTFDMSATMSSWEEYKELMKILANSSEVRDKTITRQVEKLVADAEKKQVNTNIFLAFGYAHAHAVFALPERIRSVTSIDIPDFSKSNSPAEQIGYRRLYGYDISDELYKAGFEELVLRHAKGELKGKIGKLLPWRKS